MMLNFFSNTASLLTGFVSYVNYWALLVFYLIATHLLNNESLIDKSKKQRLFKKPGLRGWEIFQSPRWPDSTSASWGVHCYTVWSCVQVRVGYSQLQLRAYVYQVVVKAAFGSSLSSTCLAKKVASPTCIHSPGRELNVSCFDHVLGCTGKDGLLVFWGLGGLLLQRRSCKKSALEMSLSLPDPVSY